MPINRCQQNYDMSKKDHITLVSASPQARKFARELGIDINEISGSERQGRVTEKDIKVFVSTKSNENIKKGENKKEEKINLEYLHSEFPAKRQILIPS